MVTLVIAPWMLPVVISVWIVSKDGMKKKLSLQRVGFGSSSSKESTKERKDERPKACLYSGARVVQLDT